MSETKASNKRLVIKLTVGVVLMFGFAYMLVPLYTLVCKQTGINGGGNAAAVAPKDMAIDYSRTIKVDFASTVHGNMTFDFRPLNKHVEVHPGETKLIYYYAQNTTGHPLTVQAIPSITPDDAARFLKKTECFCFTQQYFFKGEKADMPVYFYVDPKVPKDIEEITLSYTLFDATGFEKSEEHFTKGRIEL